MTLQRSVLNSNHYLLFNSIFVKYSQL